MLRKAMVVLLFAVLFSSVLFLSAIDCNETAHADSAWFYNQETKTLTITPTANIGNYYSWLSGWGTYDTPWHTVSRTCEHLVLQEGITRIGSHAFDGFKQLQDIVFPTTLMSIGFEAFSNCSSLLTVVFPQGMPLALDGGYCFSDCKALKYVYIPDNVTLTSSGNFDGCSSLTDVTLPSNLTDIPNNTFSSCNSLLHIEIPRGVTILKGIFSNCKGLKEFVVPSSITRIENGAFTGCISLEKVVIPPSVTFIQDRATQGSITALGAFNACDFNKLVFYVVDGSYAHNWAKRHGYQYTFVSPTLDDINIPRNKACFIISDEAGNPITDAKVTFDGIEGTTNGSGLVYFIDKSGHTPVVTVEKSGYVNWSNQGMNWKQKKPAVYQITLFPVGTNELKLVRAYYEPVSSPTYMIDYDLLTETKKIYLSSNENAIIKPGSGHFQISCVAVNPSKAYRYELIQGATVVSTCTDGLFDLNDNQFVKGKECKIRVYDQAGHHYDSHINLEVLESKVNKETSFSIKDMVISIAVDDDIPLIGGSTFTFDLSTFGSKFYLYDTGSEIEVGINLKKTFGDDEKKDPLKEAKKFISDVKKAANLQPGKFKQLSSSQKKTFKKLANEQNDAYFFDKAKLTFIGYGKYDYENNTISADIVVSISTGMGFSQTFWVVVPVVVSAKCDLSVAGNLEVTYDIDKDVLSGNLNLSPKVKLSGFAGVGIGHLIGAGAYGSLELSSQVEILPRLGIDTIDLEGELGIKAYVGWFEHERAIAYQTWNLYTRNEVASQSITEQIRDGMYDSSQYAKTDTAYLQKESEWLGEANPNLVGAMSEAGMTSIQPLLTGTYRNAQPRMVSNGEKVYAAFLKMNETGTGIQTVLTSFDGINWKTPVIVDENAYADDAPKLCFDQAGTLWLAYARTNSTAINTLLEYAESQSIIVGWVDPETLSFHQSREYAAAQYAHGHQLSSIDGKATLVWLDSVVETSDDVLWPSEAIIRSAICEDGEWCEADTVSEVNGVITDLTIREAEDHSLRIGYFKDADGNSVTKDDISLYEASEQGDILQAENCGGILNIAATGAGETQFVWNERDALCFPDGTRIEAEGISKNYVIFEDRIYYSADTDGKADLFVMYYDSETGMWNQPVRLTNGGRYLEDISVVQMNGQYYLLGMHTDVSISNDTVTDDKNLVWTQIRAMNDLCITDAGYDTEGLVPGEDMTMTLFIANRGDHDIQAIYIEELDQTFTCNIPQGTEGELEITFPCPDKLTEYTFTAAEPGETDVTPNDNTFTVAVGYSDLSISAQLNNKNGQYSIVAIVSNEGIQSTRGTVIFSGSDGTEYAHTDIYTLKAGENCFTTLEIDNKVMPGFDMDVYMTVISVEEDWTDANNTAHIKESLDCIIGTCGTDAFWKLTRDGNLSITGEGAVKAVAGVWPWKIYYSLIDTVTVAEGITSIQGNGAFNGCLATEFILPDTMTACGEYTFANCAGLSSFTIPSLTECVGAGMFSQCINLEQVTLSANTTALGDFAFNGCTQLEEVIGIEHILNIGKSAFSGCTGLTSFVMPPTIKSVPERMFSGCSNLEQVTLSGMTENIGNGAFHGCTQLKKVIGINQIRKIGWSAFSSSELTDIELDNVYVDIAAFENCNALTEVTLGSNVSLHFTAFSNCANLNKVVFREDNTYIDFDTFFFSDNVVFWCRNTSTAYTYAKTNYIPCILTNEKMDADFRTPSGTKVLEEEAFSGCGFTSVKLNDGLETIGHKAFAECENMMQIDIPASVTTIAYDAFDENNPFLIIFCEEGSYAHLFAEFHEIDYITTKKVAEGQ